MNTVVEFIKRRFLNDSHWVDGNCFYFAVILKARFPEGIIYYDVVMGHFIFKYNGEFFDWNGKFIPDMRYIVEWEKFDEYDSLQKESIIKGCIL